ncbi:MAG TPA: D-aminoacyl-tRNA deacylase [Bryobacteraceae bacterium]|nr:D-aminoacyl-tRNA deacylase [Bryobacteraceae bacterium]
MRAVVQRVSEARVKVDGQTVGSIGSGLLVLVGVSEADTKAQAECLARKIAGLRIFSNDRGKMDLNVEQVGGGVLVISQFTLWGDVRKGNRPSFDRAAGAELARDLYEYFVEQVRQAGLTVETGVFQATMEVGLVNQGPVTILLDTERNF